MERSYSGLHFPDSPNKRRYAIALCPPTYAPFFANNESTSNITAIHMLRPRLESYFLWATTCPRDSLTMSNGKRYGPSSTRHETSYIIHNDGRREILSRS